MIPYTQAKKINMTIVEGGGSQSLTYSGLEIKALPYKVEYMVGDVFSLDGLMLYATYEEGYLKDVKDVANCNFHDGEVLTEAYEGDVVFSYTEDGKTFTASYQIIVNSGISWSGSKASDIADFLAECYAGHAVVTEYMNVGDVRAVTLLDGNVAHFVLVKQDAYQWYEKGGSDDYPTFTGKGLSKFAVAIKEAYPSSENYASVLASNYRGSVAQKFAKAEPLVPNTSGSLTDTKFCDLLPADFRQLFKLIDVDYYMADGSGSSADEQSFRSYARFKYPEYTNYDATPNVVSRYYALVPAESINMTVNNNGYYDKDTSADSNRILRSIYDNETVVNTVYGRGHTINRNNNYWYRYYDVINTTSNTASPAVTSTVAGATFMGAI